MATEGKRSTWITVMRKKMERHNCSLLCLEYLGEVLRCQVLLHA